MAKFILLIDIENESKRAANNWIVYRDTISDVISRFCSHHNQDSDNIWDEDIQANIQTFVNEVLIDDKEPNDEKIKDIVSYKIFDEDYLMIPNHSHSFLFMFNDGKEDAMYKSVEERIAGYSLRLMLEDLEYTSCYYNGDTYHGEDFGYNMTDRSVETCQKAQIHFDWRDDIELLCYSINNVVIES